jgi:hypothetical protein
MLRQDRDVILCIINIIIKYVYKLYIVGDWHLELVNQCDNHLELLLSDTWGVH